MGSLLKSISELISIVTLVSSHTLIFPFKIDVVSTAPILDGQRVVNCLFPIATLFKRSAVEETKTSTSSEGSLSSAIKDYQMFNNLKTTGILDEQTINNIRHSTCWLQDLFPKKSRKRRYVLSGYKWNQDKITFKLLEDTMPKDDYPDLRSRALTQLERALKTWQEFIPIKLELYGKNPSLPPDVLVSFETGKHGKCQEQFDGPYGAHAHASLPTPDLDRFIHFDKEDYWNIGLKPPSWFEKYVLFWRYPRINFNRIAVHEIGHVLGLSHSNDQNAVMSHRKMSSAYDKTDPIEKLEKDDILAIQTLYPRK